MPYKFSSSASETPPKTPTTELLDRVLAGEIQLSRKEKDRVAEILYGTFGAHGSTYRLGGWAWNMNHHLFRILVHSKYYGWKEYRAPDKTSLRKILSGIGDPILEMIEIDHAPLV